MVVGLDAFSQDTGASPFGIALNGVDHGVLVRREVLVDELHVELDDIGFHEGQ